MIYKEALDGLMYRSGLYLPAGEKAEALRSIGRVWTPNDIWTYEADPLKRHKWLKGLERNFRNMSGRTIHQDLALSLIGFAHAESLEGTDHLTELFDAHYSAGKVDLKLSGELDEYRAMLENKSRNHFDGAANSWVMMEGRNNHIIYRIAKTADAHLQRYLLDGDVEDLAKARSYLEAMSAGLSYITEDIEDMELISGVIKSIKGTPLPINMS